MYDFFEADATLLQEELQTPQERIADSLYLIESTLDWYDHIACAFLLYEDPHEALEKISSLQSSYSEKLDGWRQIVLTPLFQSKSDDGILHKMSEKLAEVLHVLKHYKLLNLLEIAVSSPNHVDPQRLKLFKIIDNMKEEEAKLWIDQLISQEGFSKTDPTWCLEMTCLKWIEEGKISTMLLRNLPAVKPPVTPERLNVSLLPNNEPRKSDAISCSKFDITHGLCIIINQMRFYVNQDLPDMSTKEKLAYRYGSDADRDKLSETFRMLGHAVEIYENLTREELLNTMAKISTYDFKSFDGLVMCILSHGEKGVIFSSDSIPIPLDTIKAYFDGTHCPSLVEKPKLFILQACQGQASQRRVPYDDIESDGVLPSTRQVPAVSNFLEVWATVPGFLSYRSTYKGAVFVRELCHVLQVCAHTSGLSDLMTIVNDRVAKWVGGQMPCTVSCLTRGVQFKRDEEKLVEAIVDKLERELMDLAIMSATRHMWRSDPVILQTLNAWRS